MKKALLYLFVFVAVQLVLGFAAQVIMKLWLKDVNPEGALPLIVTTAVISIVTVLLFLGMKWYAVSRSYVRTRPWSVLLWTAILALGIIIPLARLEEMLPEAWTKDLIADEMAKIFSRQEGYFVVCMLVPLMEELVFRGAIITALTEWLKDRPYDQAAKQWLIIVISACFFAGVHMNPAQIPHAMIVGILLGWLFVRTGSILPGFILHWVNNSAAYTLIKVFPTIPADAKLAAYFGGNTSAVAQAVLFSLLIALPALFMVYTLTKEKPGQRLGTHIEK